MVDLAETRRFAVLASFFGWFFVAASIAADYGFVPKPDSPPFMIGLGFAIPLIAMIYIYSRHKWFWSFVNSLDLRFLVLLHFFRFIGGNFLLKYAAGQLPGSFALPAGIGDLFVAITSIPVAYLISRGSPHARFWFIAWNLFGLLDFVVALTTGILNSETPWGIFAHGGPTTAIIAQLPLVLIPTFFVPLFFASHLLMLKRRNEVK